MMKNIAATFLGFACLALVAQAAAPGPGYAPPTAGLGAPPAQQGMTAFQAWQILQSNGFLARPYYSGVPDPIAVRRVDNRARMRALLTAKLNTLVIPSIAAMNDFTMEEAIEALENIFKNADPAQEGFRMFINQFVDPGGVPLQNNGSGATSGPAGPGGQQNVDPTTGLPLGLGAPGGGAGGQPQIDPTTGLPINSGASGVGGAPPGGLPGVGGVPPGGAAPGLPGMAAPGAGAGGLPGLGGGGAMPGLGGGGGSSGQGAFDPTTVRVRGLKKELRNLTAKQVLDVVCMSLDTPIQYVVTDQGIMFLQQRQELWGTVTRKFQLNLNMRTLQMMGASVPKLTPPTNNGGGQGQGSGGGQGGFGQGPGGGQGGGGYGPGMGGPGMGGPGMGGPGMGGAPGGGTQFRVPGTTGGFGAGYRPFNLHRFNSGFAPSPFQPRQ